MTKNYKDGGPGAVSEDKPEIERKYRVMGDGVEERAARLDEIFNFVVSQKDHFVTLDRAPHTNGFPKELVDLPPDFPLTQTYLRTRYYWANADLDGYKPGDTGKAEIRTEKKIEKGCWKQTLKLGGNGSKTLTRGEYQRYLDGFGVNLSVYKKEQRKAAQSILGDKPLKPLARIDSQSRLFYYHPDGREDVLFEIKFDKGIGRTFNGYALDIVEIEIEVKDKGRADDKDIERLLNKTEEILDTFGGRDDILESIHESKPAPLFRHLVECRSRNSGQGFRRDFEHLTGTQWQDDCTL